MRVLTAGFKSTESEAIGQAARAAGHTVVSGATLEVVKVLLASAKPDTVLLSETAPKALRTWFDEERLELEVLSCDLPRACARLSDNPLGRSQRLTGIQNAGTTPEVVATPVSRPPGPPVSSGNASELSLERKLNEVRFCDYHTILEVELGASTYVVRTAYEKLAACYAPEQWPHALGADDLDQLHEIQRGLEDAIALLGQPKYQAQYELAHAQHPSL